MAPLDVLRYPISRMGTLIISQRRILQGIFRDLSGLLPGVACPPHGKSIQNFPPSRTRQAIRSVPDWDPIAMTQRSLLPLLSAFFALCAHPCDAQDPAASGGGERTLDNGIVLPETWPPRDREVLSVEPMPVPYLATPPAVIPIDVGRQLFVDDFLIEETDLVRTFHPAERLTPQTANAPPPSTARSPSSPRARRRCCGRRCRRR